MHSFHWIFKRLLSRKGLRCQTFTGTQDPGTFVCLCPMPWLYRHRGKPGEGMGEKKLGTVLGGPLETDPGGDPARPHWTPSKSPAFQRGSGSPRGDIHTKAFGQSDQNFMELVSDHRMLWVSTLTSASWTRNGSCGPPGRLDAAEDTWLLLGLLPLDGDRILHFCCDGPSTALTHVSGTVSWPHE